MSLVNNMLRDLDQRRKDSDSSSGAARLFPAREYSSEGKKNLLPIVFAALMLVLIGLIYFWTLVSGSDVEQRLDIQAQSSLSDSDRIVQELEESIAIAEERESLVESLENPQIAAQGGLQEEPNRIEPAAANFLRGGNDAVESATPSIASTSRQDRAIESSELPQGADLEVSVDGPSSSMKQEPRYSNEQLDTIAVQEALRLLANNETEAAYTALEQYIIGNRNAHQSRETYAKLLMSNGRRADAAALIEAGLDLVPNHAGFKKVKARLLMSAGNIPEAVATLISRAPDIVVDSEYHDLLASAQLSSRDYSGAIISYKGLLEHDRTQGKWWYGYAAANDQLGNSAVARQAYLRSMQLPNLSANLRRRSQERAIALGP
ncbi:MAG: tetratricopeptide repeat protein [Gammaproteobacteria bacterium]|nr:tetratricopeptide repeat protein [Gammaproteobacteria bacterium]